LLQTHVVLKAFVAGQNLSELGHDRMMEIFGEVLFARPGCLLVVKVMPSPVLSQRGLSANGRARLEELARLLLLDILLNNGDRLPLIWENR
jgi:hypothetical protein